MTCARTQCPSSSSQIDKLNSLDNVRVIKNARSHRILGNGSKVTSLEYEDRSSGQMHNLEVDGVFVQIGLVPNSAFVKGLVDTTARWQVPPYWST